ncbi:hypothetical protein BC939DRAFT_480983 [Gamsiella multidivaricata]|uniref:uncharacterized protein n=1 Tax=Gamsiella multidivaricata TaxID=101098 RepID=UPI00221F1267|nr:uncharacterized protein BC939DRAFT_480983 [Gamsiella multidivaricata]KAI7817673.1 hypothetical protein BC939DRAFT_480983 [Gamsiella multidivaricata]
MPTDDSLSEHSSELTCLEEVTASRKAADALVYIHEICRAQKIRTANVLLADLGEKLQGMVALLGGQMTTELLQSRSALVWCPHGLAMARVFIILRVNDAARISKTILSSGYQCESVSETTRILEQLQTVIVLDIDVNFDSTFITPHSFSLGHSDL